MALPLAPTRVDTLAVAKIERAGQIIEAPRALALWHLASFDAPTVAVVWSLAFAWENHRYLPLWVPLLLALTTWAVYVGDRLLDARRGLRSEQNALRERHYFHWRHRRVLGPLAVAAACSAAGIILVLMGPMARERDSVLAAAAFFYFSGVHLRRDARPVLPRFVGSFLNKEFLVGVLFTAGCVLPSFPRTGAAIAQGWLFWACAVFFAALAWLNCRCIAGWEAGEVVSTADWNRTRNGPIESGRRGNRSMAVLLAAAGLALAWAAHASNPRTAALIAAGAASALLLALLDRARHRIAPLTLRAAADLVLLTPMVLLLR